MNETKRPLAEYRRQAARERLARPAAIAREYDERGDVVLRAQTADTWREIATWAEAKRAPKYLTWTGRSREERKR